MFRFTIRDLLWLTLVVAFGTAWWLLWRATPMEAKASGSITVSGMPLSDGRICLQSADGQIVGARVEKGRFLISKAPVGTFGVTIEGEGVPAKYSANSYGLSIEVRRGMNTFDFNLQ